jgi:hypothetical protein
MYDITGVKANAIPVHAWRGPVGYKRMRLPDFKISQDGGKVVSLTYPQKIFLVLISVEG